jgi:serine/threonine protein phosphatase PrpC
MSFELLEEETFDFKKGGSGRLIQNTSAKFEVEAKASNNSSTSSSKSSKANKVCDLDSTYVLQQAAAKIKAVGSSTAVVSILNPNNLLCVSNLGDSGFLHYRQRDCQTTLAPGSLTQ